MKLKIGLIFIFIIILSATIGAVYAATNRAAEPASGVIDIDKTIVRAPILMPPLSTLAIIRSRSGLKKQPINPPGLKFLKKRSVPKLGPLGTLLKMNVKEGENIRQGRLLAEVDPTLFRAALNIADARIIKAQAGLNMIEDKIADLNTNLDKLNFNLSKSNKSNPRLPAMANGKNATASPNPQLKLLSQAKLKLSKTKSQLSAALSELEKTKIQAQKGLELATIARDRAKNDLERLKIYAPVSGYIARVYAKAGEITYPNQTLVDIYKNKDVKMIIYLPPEQAKITNLGQSAQVTVDSFPNMKFTAKITHISPDLQFAPSTLPTNLTQLLNVQAVTLKVHNRHGILKPGMPADSFIMKN